MSSLEPLLLQTIWDRVHIVQKIMELPTCTKKNYQKSIKKTTQCGVLSVLYIYIVDKLGVAIKDF